MTIVEPTSPIKMKLLLLCLGLTLVCAHKKTNSDAEEDSFDMPECYGPWYSICLASTDEAKIEENGSMNVFVEKISGNATSLNFAFHKKENGQCTALELTCERTGKNEYAVEYDGSNLFWAFRVNCSDHAMFYLQNKGEDNGEGFKTMELYARKPNVDEKLKELFKTECGKRGISFIRDLTVCDRCLKYREGGKD